MAGDDVDHGLPWSKEQVELRETDRRLHEANRAFARGIAERRRHLRLILVDKSQEWPPPAKLAPWADWSLKEFPKRDEARLIVECRNRLRTEGRPHAKKRYASGLHVVVEELRLAGHRDLASGWPKVKWALDVFGDVIVVEDETSKKKQAKALDAIERQKQELLEANGADPPGVMSLEDYWRTK